MATREQLIEDFADHKYATGEKFARLINSMKLVQEPVESPAESGTSNSFIDSISQGADGKITATKKSVVLNYAQIQDKPTINGVTLMGDKTPAQLGLATANQVEVVSNKVDKLPSGYYYGKFNSVEDLPEATEKGYAYVASSDPTVFYTYLVSGAGAEWVDSGNKMVNTIDITTPKTSETELSKEEKYYASANVSDRSAVVVAETGIVKSLGYRVLNPNLSFAEQVAGVNNANMIFEIKDSFDLNGGSVTIPAGCTLKFEGGTVINGTIVGDKTVVVSPPVKVFSDDCALSGTWVGEGFVEWFGDNFEKCINVFKNIRLLPGKTYELSSTLKMPAEASIIGNGSSTIHTDGTFDVVWMGFKCTINGVIFKTDIPCNTIVVCFEQIAATKQVDTQTTSLNYKGVDAHILIENVIIQSKGSANNAQVYAIKVISDGAKYSNISGFWGVTIRKVSIGGDYYYGVTFDNGTCENNVSANPWLTSCLVEDVSMENVRNCFFIGQNNKGSSNTFRVGYIVFRRCQAQRNWNIGYLQQDFFKIERANNITIESCNPQDFDIKHQGVDDNNTGESTEYKVNKTNCQNIVLLCCNGNYKLEGTGTNSPLVVQSPPIGYVDFTHYLDEKWFPPTNSNYYTAGDMRLLPDGNYSVLYSLYTKLGLSGTYPAGDYFVFRIMTTASYKGASQKFIIGMYRSTSSNRQLMAIAFLDQFINDDTKMADVWRFAEYTDLKRQYLPSSERPNKTTMSSNSLGVQIYDSTLGKPIFWGGYAWKSADGNFVYDQEGSITQRPLSSFNNKQYKEQVDNDTVRYLVCIDSFFYNAENGEIMIDATGNLNDLTTNYPHENNKGIQVQLTDTDPFLNNRILKIVEPTSSSNCQWYDKDLKTKLRVPDPVITFDDTNNTATVTCDCESATIRYRTKVSEDFRTYTGTINLEEGDQLNVIASRSNMLSSFYISKKAVAPVIEIDEETNLATMTSETDGGATIYYTLDGNDPTTESSVYQTPIEVTPGTTIKAFAVKIGRVNSDITTETY